MLHSAEIRKSIADTGVTGIVFNETPTRLTVKALGYSSHSSLFDTSFRLAEKLNISYRGMNHSQGGYYTITFYKPV